MSPRTVSVPCQIYTDISVGGTAVVLESNFDENVVSGNGGAIYATGMELLYVYNSTFDSNSADSSGARGGAIYAGRDVELELELNRFIENSAHDGSAVACCGGSMREVQVIRSATADVSDLSRVPCLTARIWRKL